MGIVSSKYGYIDMSESWATLWATPKASRKTSFLLSDDDLITSAAQNAREAAIAAEAAAQAAKVAIAEISVARQASGNARKQIHYLQSAMEGPSPPVLGD